MIIEREVLIIGAGPTGCVVATLLARHGHQVLLISDDGREGGLPVETVVPGASRTFERLGWSPLLEDPTPHPFLHPGPSRRGRCWGSSMLDIQPLEKNVGEIISNPDFEDIRVQHQRGRRHRDAVDLRVQCLIVTGLRRVALRRQRPLVEIERDLRQAVTPEPSAGQ